MFADVGAFFSWRSTDFHLPLSLRGGMISVES